MRNQGYTVHTLWSVYGEDLEEQVPDEDWIEDGGKKGWILLSKDDIRYTPPAKEAMEKGKAKVFYLGRQDLPGPVQEQWFVTNLNRIIVRAQSSRARRKGGCAWAVHEDDVIAMYP